MSDIDWGPATDFMEGLGNFLLKILKSFQEICRFIFTNGNCLFFLFFLIMGVYLLINAKEKEEHERIYARNLEYIKKRGRTGIVVSMLLAVGFLSKGLIVFLDWCFGLFSTPIFFSFDGMEDFYNRATSWEAITLFNPLESFLYFLFSLISFFAILAFTFGIYLIFFNKRILRTKLKSYKVLIGGLALIVIYGVPTSILLMI